MSHVNFTINGRQYRMACEDGQEGHLLKLAKDLDHRIDQLRSQFGEIGDMRLVVMAALTIADQLIETEQQLRQLENDVSALQNAGENSAERTQAAEAAMVAALNSAAERIERMTKTLNQSLGNGVAIG